ncbi:zinc-finger homeodomain protein 3-like isoform X2 [Tasmannia lanceolata]|uniref:zinc-finger homeodomain protein 3-like isoform X2 n=1 Tax=Tasmannia lanceolata TaxID=3420 RepID=UPI0040637680
MESMDISSHEPDIPIPLNSSYGGVHGHMIHDPPPHNHIIPSSAPALPSNGPLPTNLEDQMPYKKLIRYRECLKNHAASMGGNATDGCGEFMPSGEEGTLEAFKCSACNCHRNFHRKDIEGSEAFGYPTNSLIPRPPHPHMIMSYNLGLPSESDEQEGGGGVLARPPLMKKRYRTKFSQEQKEKMLGFAEKVGWRLQKQDESVVQQFCQEIGIRRRVLKVWMHNNKHNLAKKDSN